MGDVKKLNDIQLELLRNDAQVMEAYSLDQAVAADLEIEAAAAACSGSECWVRKRLFGAIVR